MIVDALWIMLTAVKLHLLGGLIAETSDLSVIELARWVDRRDQVDLRIAGQDGVLPVAELAELARRVDHRDIASAMTELTVIELARR